MQLILWRHASANSFNGYDRMLDPTGHKQAAQGGQWLATPQSAYPHLDGAAGDRDGGALSLPQRGGCCAQSGQGDDERL